MRSASSEPEAARFTWTTSGARVTTVADNFEPERYLSWTGRGRGARGHMSG